MKVRMELILVLLILAMSLLPAMWNEAVNFTYSASYLMSSYPEAARWLVENMWENESAIVPFPEVFEALEPYLRGRLRPYSDTWKGANVFLEADNDLGDILTVRRYLLQYLKQEKIGYILVSPNDPYCAPLFEGEIHDELVLFKISEFHTESSLWNEPITIYKFARARREVFNLTLTTKPERFDVQGNIQVSFDQPGMVIQYEGDSGVYIPTSFDSSRIEKLLLTVYVTDMSLGVKGNIVLYLDKDGDGRWGGWDVDTGLLIPIPQKPWWQDEIIFFKEFYKIGYNIIQIGIVLYGESSQTLAVKTLTFYEAYEPGT